MNRKIYETILVTELAAPEFSWSAASTDSLAKDPEATDVSGDPEELEDVTLSSVGAVHW